MQLTDADQSRYARICAELSATVATYPAALRQRCLPTLDTLLAGEFSQLAALLPVWLADLIPLDVRQLHDLGTAGLWLWWYASVLDGLIDGDVDAAALLGGQQALLAALEIYRHLGLADTPTWDDLLNRALCAADAYAREVSTRHLILTDVRDEDLDLWSLDLLMDRSAPFAFTLSAQLHLAGSATDDPRQEVLTNALRGLTAARQIADDAGDWIADLQRGHLNIISAGLVRHFRQTRPNHASTLSIEQLAGYEIHAEAYWTEVEQTHAHLCQQALDGLTIYGECQLRQLIGHQQRSDTKGWERMRERRVEVRNMFRTLAESTFIPVNHRLQ